MKKNAAVIGLLIWATPISATQLFLSLSQGYTHYEAEDLNRVLVLLEKTTQVSGFNNYEVSQFDGHPQQAVVAGFQIGAWRFGLEAEFWTESFEQTEVPFDLENAERDYRIDCASLRAGGNGFDGLAGCVQAQEVFLFLPITLQVSREILLSPSWRLAPGAGLGVMAGSASIRMKTDYFGKFGLPSDDIRYSVDPGINTVQKYFVDLEFRSTRFLGGFLGFQTRLGWRITHMPQFTLKDETGNSQVFDIVFPEAENGAILYIQSVTSRPEDDQIFFGSEASARKLAEIGESRFRTVTGDFTGWFASLKLNVYWGL